MQLTSFLFPSLIALLPLVCSAKAPTSTVTIAVPIPPEGTPFTTTLKACGTVPAVIVEGFTNGTFVPGTQTIFLPPQADPTSSTFINEEFNLTQVIIGSPLPGSCAPLSLPADATSTVETGTASPTPTGGPNACPLKGCSKGVNAAAQKIITTLDEVTIVSQRLQAAAKRLDSFFATDQKAKRFGFNPVSDVVVPLRDIVATLGRALGGLSKRQDDDKPTVFPPGCSSDTIVVALIDFVEVHTALLEIFISKAPDARVKAAFADDGEPQSEFGIDFVATAIQGVLRSIETVVDDFTYDLISLIPTYDKCIQKQQKGLDTVLNEAIEAYN